MIAEVRDSDPAEQPIWRRIVDFPLVAMVFAVLLFVCAVLSASFIGHRLPLMPAPWTDVARAAIAIALLLAVYKLVIVRLGEQPRDDLPFAEAPKGLGLGVLLGFLIFGSVVGVAALLDVYNIVGPGGTSELVTALMMTAVIPGFVEELLFRGILFRWFEAFGGSWFALALTSALFGLVHIFNPNATWFSALAIALEAGVLLGGAYMLTRNLWLAMGLHASWNFTQGEIFDVPVSGFDQHGLVEAKLSGPVLLSGGTFGLEASVIAMVIATGAGIYLVWLALGQGALVRPWWVRRRLALAGSEEAVGVDVDADPDLGAPLDRA